MHLNHLLFDIGHYIIEILHWALEQATLVHILQIENDINHWPVLIIYKTKISHSVYCFQNGLLIKKFSA